MGYARMPGDCVPDLRVDLGEVGRSITKGLRVLLKMLL